MSTATGGVWVISEPEMLRANAAARSDLIVAKLQTSPWQPRRGERNGDRIRRYDRLAGWVRLAHLVVVPTVDLCRLVHEHVGSGCPPVAVVPEDRPDLLEIVTQAGLRRLEGAL